MRDQVRAVLVTLHLLAVFLMSAPAPAGMTQQSLQDPHLQTNFQDWSNTAQQVGVDLSPEEMTELAWTWGSRVLDVRRKILAPFQPYYKYAGTRQSWQMFGYLNRKPGRLEVATCDKPVRKKCNSDECCQANDWEWRFIMGSDEANWMRPKMEQERMRAIVSSFAWKKRVRHYDALGRWLTQEAAVEFPEAQSLRIRMGTLMIPTPEKLQQLGEVPVGQWYWDRNYPIVRSAE